METALIVLLVVLLHIFVFYLLTRKKKNIKGFKVFISIISIKILILVFFKANMWLLQVDLPV